MPGSHPPPRSSGQVALYPWLWGPLPVAVRPPLLLPRPATSSRTLGRWTPCRPRSWAIEGDLKKGINPHNMTIWSFFDMINHGTWGKTWKTSERDVRIIKWYTARSCIPNLHPILILIRLLLLLIIIIIIILLRDGLSAQALLTVQSTTSKRGKSCTQHLVMPQPRSGSMPRIAQNASCFAVSCFSHSEVDDAVAISWDPLRSLRQQWAPKTSIAGFFGRKSVAPPVDQKHIHGKSGRYPIHKRHVSSTTIW